VTCVLDVCIARSKHRWAAIKGTESVLFAFAPPSLAHADAMASSRAAPPQAGALRRDETKLEPPLANAFAHHKAVASKASSPARRETRVEMSSARAAAQDARNVTASATELAVSPPRVRAYWPLPSDVMMTLNMSSSNAVSSAVDSLSTVRHSSAISTGSPTSAILRCSLEATSRCNRR
jgi:hypothetical protein